MSVVCRLLFAAALLPTLAAAQSELSGYHQYPQFRTMSGLPGSSFPLTRLGEVDGRGAISLSTPIAYGLGNGRLVFGAMAVADGRRPRFSFDSRGGARGGNGTGQILYGTQLGRYGNLTSSVMVLSNTRDQAFNFQWTPPQRSDRVTFAVGVQDLFGDGGASGAGQPGDGNSSTSLYAVATGEVAREVYVSLGAGTRRFEPVFANVSTTVLPNTKLYAEYDAFNFNVGAAWFIALGPRERTRSALTLNAGLIRGKYLSLAANLSF